MRAEKEREYWLRERGYSVWKPAYYELSEEQRGWLAVGNVDPRVELCRVLDALPGERLLRWCQAYADAFDEAVETAEDARESAWALACFMVEDVQEMGAADFERRFPVRPEDLDEKVLDMLRIWAREEDMEFYE